MKRQKNHSKIYKIDGVGVNLEKFYPVKSIEEKQILRGKKGFSANDFILIYTAEFIPRKNHKLLFDILPKLKNKIPTLKIIFCGKGELLENYKEFAKKNTMDYVIFTGYTKEVADYCRLSDVLVMPSLQEGLPMAMIEAIATGLPVVASKIRGHIDVIASNEYGFLCNLTDKEGFCDAIFKLYSNEDLRKAIGLNNIERAKIYSVDIAVSKMAEIYLSCIN